jgi:hypothetical protein
LEKELTSIAVNVLTALGGGNHGHAGIIVKPTKYLVMTGETAFGRTNTCNGRSSAQRTDCSI